MYDKNKMNLILAAQFDEYLVWVDLMNYVNHQLVVVDLVNWKMNHLVGVDLTNRADQQLV